MVRAFFEDERVLAFFTDRHGGVSKGKCESLNVSSNVGDNIRNIVQNRQIISDKENFLVENIVYMKQIHSDNVQIIQNSFINEIKNCDGIITQKRKIPLMTMAADCAPVLLYDSKRSVIAALHSGRVGTYKNIVQKCINKMQDEFNSKADDIMVEVGPSIGACCYEIGEDLALNYDKRYLQMKKDKYFLDLKLMLKDELLECGIKENNLNVSQICTCCNEDYFSYRRDGITGRFCGIIMLK